MAKSNKVNLMDITDLPLEEQIYQILRGRGFHTRFVGIDLRELAEEIVFTLDFVNGDNPDQPIILNTLPEITGEDGVPALDLIKRFGLDDYVMESVLNG